MKSEKLFFWIVFIGILFSLVNCSKEDEVVVVGKDPDLAEKVQIDRFSETAGNLFIRDASNGLPDANKPIHFDEGAFITQGLSPSGQSLVKYYNFDVQPLAPSPIFVLFREGESVPVTGQLNIINAIPGESTYSDFWHVNKVIVPTNYIANVVTSYQEILEKGYTIEQTTKLVNCPVVPDGSTANLRYNSSESKELVRGWYKGKIVFYFTFEEKELVVRLPMSGQPEVPVSDILVTFNINPDQSGGGPASGFATEPGSAQTHNVIQTMPEDGGYSPLWDVDVYDNADFVRVFDWASASNSSILAEGVALVNCPVVLKQDFVGKDPDLAEKVQIDRFSESAGNLFIRDASNGLPEADMPIDFDEGAFITQGLSPDGQAVKYYNFDIQPLEPSPIYVLFHEGETMPVPGQLNIINAIPGDSTYNDFWHVQKVIVPANYTANIVTSYQEILDKGYPIEQTTKLVNCPVVPEGSTTDLRYNSTESNQLVRGWYKGKIVFYFTFEEKELVVRLPMSGQPEVPVSDILVTFNINPDQTGGGPASGFVTEPGSMQTHNVIQTMPENGGYSPLWDVNVYDNTDFVMVSDWKSASSSNILAEGVALVNCPVVWKQ